MTIKKVIITNTAKVSSPVQTSQVYKGFSSNKKRQNFKVFDIECIRQDLINHFNTRRGERVMNPTFGTVIWDTIFEPLTDDTRATITEDIRALLSNDPRVIVQQVNIDEQQTGILLELTLTYRLTDQSATLALNFNRELGLVVQ